MKNYKEEIIARMIEKSADEKIVSLRETAAELGISHISAQDCAEETSSTVSRRLKVPAPSRS